MVLRSSFYVLVMAQRCGVWRAYSTGNLGVGITQFIAQKDQTISSLVRQLKAEKQASLIHANTHNCTPFFKLPFISGVFAEPHPQQLSSKPTVVTSSTQKRESLQTQLGFKDDSQVYREFRVPSLSQFQAN
jgi:hypothetical protein